MKNPSCIFFDFDGTLIDVRKRYYEAYTQACKYIAIEPLNAERYWDLKRNKTPENKINSLSDEQYKKYSEIRISLLEDESLLQLDTPFKGVQELLEQLRKEKHVLFIATMRRHTDRVQQEIKNLKLNNYFEEILAIAPKNKPSDDKANLIKTVSNIYDNYQQNFIVGDTEADIDCGKELQFTTVGVTSGIRSEKFIKEAHPDYILSSVTELLTIFD
jgi:phosphoglycolate phosphatase